MSVRKFILIILVSYNYYAGATDVFTCEIDGTIEFSQIPCGSIEKKHKLGKSSSFESDQNLPSINGINTEGFIYKHKVDKIIRKIESLNEQRNKALTDLNNQMNAVSQNRAGGLHKLELSKEMVTLNDRYEKLIKLQENKLKNLQPALTH